MYLQDIILLLQGFWAKNGCILLQPYDIEVGAGTSHPATALRCLGDSAWNVAYVQPCRRPHDGRYGENPNRMQHYYQFQVIQKPSPSNAQELCIDSLRVLGINTKYHDVRFIEDDWQNPTLGAWGLGWEVWCDGMEIAQFTYMQQIGGIECFPIPMEITYGLERLAMYIQNIDNVWDLKWNKGIKYADVFLRQEKEYCTYNFIEANVVILKEYFHQILLEAERLIDVQLAYPAYDYCLKAAHAFNLLEARNALGVTERTLYISKLRDAVRTCCKLFCKAVLDVQS